jgi:malonyl-CoA O-methyltransferase
VLAALRHPDMSSPAALQSRRRLRRHFDRTAPTYDRAAVVQREAGKRMLERLDLVRLQPRRILDAGSGPGTLTGPLRERYPSAELIAVDLSPAMLRLAAGRDSGVRKLLQRVRRTVPLRVCGDIAQLPLPDASIDLACSGFALEWADDRRAPLIELYRVLARGGLLMFATLGPDSWKELRAALASSGTAAPPRMHADMHDIGDALVEVGFADPVMDMDCFTLTYFTLAELMRDLRQSGACGPGVSNTTHLKGKSWREQVTNAYEAMRRDGRLPATVEVVYGHAWKPEQPRKTSDGRAVVRFDRLRGGLA